MRESVQLSGQQYHGTVPQHCIARLCAAALFHILRTVQSTATLCFWTGCAFRLEDYAGGYKYCSNWQRNRGQNMGYTTESSLAACKARCNDCWGLTYYTGKQHLLWLNNFKLCGVLHRLKPIAQR